MSDRQTFAPPMLQHLDQARLRRIRMRRGVSARHVALESGVGIAVYRRLEDGEHPDLSSISTASAVRIADCLRVPVGDLFEPSHDPDSPDRGTPADPASQETDVATLGTLLHALNTQASRVALADSLAWTQERLHSAIHRLDIALGPAGLLVFQESGRIQIRARDEADGSVEKRFREHPRATASQRLENRLRASLIAVSMERGYSPRFRAIRDTTEARYLANLGLFVDNGGDHYSVSPDILYSLFPPGLDEITGRDPASTREQEVTT